MAVLIPSLNSCVLRMASGEKRLAERLEQKLEDDYLLWYDVPMGPRNTHPDFCVMHPRRGVLVLEVKDWRPCTILQADKQNWEILGDSGPKTVINPLEQARQYAHQVVKALECETRLAQVDCPNGGKLDFAWGDMSILSRDSILIDLYARALKKSKLLLNMCKKVGDFKPGDGSRS